MIITAKFASVCPVCNARIEVGSKVEWTKGAKACHVACKGKPTAAVTASAPSARRSYAARGKWTGCSCGSREMPDGSLSANACSSCKFDHYDY